MKEREKGRKTEREKERKKEGSWLGGCGKHYMYRK
jgi:hypothetical protein